MNEIQKNIVVEAQEEVKTTFSEACASLDFGVYIAPQNYFVSYIFETEETLDKAKEIGLLQRINNYHKQLLRKKEYSEEGIKDCTSASQEDCDKEHDGNWHYYYR